MGSERRLELPPPMVRSSAALGPMSATVVSAVGSSGSAPVVPEQHHPGRGRAGTAPARCGSSTDSSGRSTVRSTASRAVTSTSTSRTSPSTTDSSTAPARTCSAEPLAVDGARSGHRHVETRVRGLDRRVAPSQSETTKPSKPHSSRRISREQVAVLRAVLAVELVVRAHDAPRAAVATAASNGRR